MLHVPAVDGKQMLKKPSPMLSTRIPVVGHFKLLEDSGKVT